ncbi:hypothetical protein [Halosimplex halophilum]|uniref:hypothetical protein n=1 Tax=Halosimplex halophilum TaxID=2559572 RepID=UPI00107F3786|nr:hypothetical protein [Halosimplex halophilum]
MIGRRASRAREAAGPAVLALLLVMSLAAPALTGLAGAQSDAWSGSVSGSPNGAVVDTSDVTGRIEIEVSTPDGPNGNHVVLYRDEHEAADTAQFVFGNREAYETINFTVSHAGPAASGEPSFGDLSNVGLVDTLANLVNNKQSKLIAGTGGDRNLNCGPVESISGVLGQQKVVECMGLPGSTTVDESLDQQEVKLEMYQSLQNTRAHGQVFSDTMDNYLEDTRGAALSEANLAYVRALENGSSKAAAMSAAKSAAADYYAAKQIQLAHVMDQGLRQYQYLRRVADNESVTSNFVRFSVGPRSEDYSGAMPLSVTDPDATVGTETVELVNGTTIDTLAMTFSSNGQVHMSDGTQQGFQSSADGTVYAIDQGLPPMMDYKNTAAVSVSGIRVEKPQSLDNPTNYTVMREAMILWSDIQQQQNHVNDNIGTMVDGTYEEYQQGDLNLSEITTARTLMREYSPGTKDESYQTYALARLAKLGVSPPDDLSEQKNMTVRVGGPNGTVYQNAILAADKNPPSGGWEVGKTYNTADIAGSEFVVSNQTMTRIPNNTRVTITSAYNQSGGKISSVTYPDVSYQTTSLEGLTGVYDKLSMLRAELAALEQNNRGGAGGGLLGGGNQTVVLVLVAGAVAVVVLSNGGRR